jgi:hypothetical protein
LKFLRKYNINFSTYPVGAHGLSRTYKIQQERFFPRFSYFGIILDFKGQTYLTKILLFSFFRQYMIILSIQFIY